MRMSFLYTTQDGEHVVKIDQELMTLLTPADSPPIRKTNEQLYLHEHVTRAKEVLPKYTKLRESFSKFLSAITEE